APRNLLTQVMSKKAFFKLSTKQGKMNLEEIY
ncbi:unnamed protein product, partial [marine sediment metagenome]